MTLEEVALIAEIAGGLAVVATLIYLVVEVKRNTAATQSSAQYTQIGVISDWNLSLVHAPGLPELIVKANEDYSSVSEAEKLKLQGYYVNIFNLWHAAYWNWKNGLLDEKGFRVWNVGTPSVVRAQVASIEAWESMKHIYDEEFRNHVESALEGECGPKPVTSVTWTSA
ncbi:MAG: hypothetical protein ACU84Q_09220 [Gammaproteobacteria bacterium]